jgi:type VI protein secretion system component VasF
VPLSDREKQLLEQIESDLLSQHPDLATSLRTGSVPRTGRLRRRQVREPALAGCALACGALIGLAVVYLGLRLANDLGTVLGVLGWAVVVAVSYRACGTWQGLRSSRTRLSRMGM